MNMFSKDLESSLCLFTDGSKKEESSFAGYAVCTLDNSLTGQFRAPGFLSSFSVELMAILSAIQICSSNNPNSISLTIFTDSRTTLVALDSIHVGHYSSYLVIKIKSIIEGLTIKGKKIKLVWIPEHKGIQGNERTDFLAKEAIRVGRDSQFGIPLEEWRNHWKERMFKELFDWRMKEGENKGSTYCKNYLNANRHPWFWKFNLPRSTISILNRLRSGHTSLRGSLFRFYIVDTPLCLICNVVESPDNVFWECPKYSSQRTALITDLSQIRGYLPHPVEYLLSTIDKDITMILHRFLSLSNLKI